MAAVASLAIAPTAALHRDADAVESGVHLRRSSEFQCKVARPVRGRGNMSTSRVQQEAKFGGAGGGIGSKNGRGVRAAVAAETAPSAIPGDAVKEGTKEYDAIVIGSGIGGLVAATQLAIRGARVILLEKYVIPGGSSGYFQREGYTFDVGSSVMFGFSEKGSINLVTKSLAAVGRTLELIEDLCR